MDLHGPQCKMKVLLCLAIVINLVSSKTNNIQEDCIVKSQFGHSGSKTSWIAYLSRSTDLAMYVEYFEKKHVIDNEELHLQIDEIYRVKIRNSETMDREGIYRNLSLPIGWTNFTSEVKNKDMNITINYNLFIINFEYPVHYLSIISENLVTCSRGKPTWEIRKNVTSTIPLGGLENIHFTLSGNTSFSPILYIKEVNLNLQYHSGVKIGHGSSPLPRGTYDFLIKKYSEHLILHSKEVNSGYVAIFEMAIADDLMNIKLSSSEEVFFLELTPENIEDVITTTALTSNPTSIRCSGNISLTVNFLIFVAGMFIGVIFYIAINCILKAKKYEHITYDNEREYGRSSRTNSKKMEKLFTKGGKKSRIRTFSEQSQQLPLVSQNDQGDVTSILDNCEAVKANGITIRKIKMSQDKENKQPKFQICYFNKIIPKENKNTKVLLLVGDPDVGKTTLINAMVNHIFGADEEYEKEHPLGIICDSDHNHKTDTLTAYCFPNQPPMIYDSHFVFIKTHHFSKTTESDHYNKIKQIKNYLDKNNGVNELHAICFVVRSDCNEVDILRNAYDSIFSLFGYDIMNHIFVLTTFDNLNEGKPQVVKALDVMQRHYNKYFRFNFNKEFLTSNQIRKDTCKNMAELFEHIDNMKPCCLKLTNVMITEKARIEEIIESLRMKITKGVDKMSELHKKESEASDPEALNVIKGELKYMEELVISKIDEAQRAYERLNELSLQTAQFMKNDFIDNLIESENNSKTENYQDRIETLQKIRERNVYMESILKAKSSERRTSIFQYFKDNHDIKED